MASGSLTRQRSVSNRQEAPQIVLPKGKDNATEAPFEPCAATASHFLLTQGSTVLVLAHDTLGLERRFQSHQDDIKLIACDNVSERGAGRLVVTYDVGKTAIIWDLFTGEQISRFASYEPLLVAAWMRNGNIAFGNERGDVILFEPSTSEHISARTIFDPITALAPSSDCKTYAIGYKNGSILLAALQPQFTILHTLNTSRSPSPIAMLTWHASSSKQKSDMLAIQNSDGDLRVWSVPKPPTSGQPRVIRILKREERFVSGRNWVSWSRNGRILQFSEGETWAWDVRTKDVNYIPVPTIEFVRGIAAHGPTASLFTLGPDYTVQQYDADTGQMLANIRHTPISIPPTPPEDHIRQFNRQSYEDELSSPLRAARYEGDFKRSETPASAHSHSVSSASKKSTEKKPNTYEVSSPAKTVQTATTFSQGAYNHSYSHPQTGIPASPASSKVNGQRKGGSRLRQEVVMSPMTPEDALAIDLFPFTRHRIGEVQPQAHEPLDEATCTQDDLRCQMLKMVFGWDADIWALIEDEMSHHPAESLNNLFLSQWLGRGPEHIGEVMGSTPVDPAMDCMRLALGVLDSRSQSKKLGQIFVEKMLSKGEVHMAAVILLGLGDKNDAIEVYVSNNCYLEAILLTCLLFPQEWERQSHLVRRWGEHVVENSQQQLARRCFACTGLESSETWASPTAALYTMRSPLSAMSSHASQQFPQARPQPSSQQTQRQEQVQVQPIYTAPLTTHASRLLPQRGFEAPTPVALIAPPTPFRAAAAKGKRITPQTGGLKLITSFQNKPAQFKFPGLKTDDMTPINASNVTPIAESAIDRSALSPGGAGSYRLNNLASINAAMSAGPVPARQRLTSIGETPMDTQSPVFPTHGKSAPKAPPTPADSGSDKEKDKLAKKMAAAQEAEAKRQEAQRERSEPALTLLTSARYTPSSTPVQNFDPEAEPQTALRPSTSTSWRTTLGRVQEESNHLRLGSMGRKPEGLSLYLHNPEDPVGARPGTVESTTTNITLSPAGDSFRVKSPSVSGKSIDQYISSLDQAGYYSRAKSANSTRNTKDKEERSERKRSKHRKAKQNEEGSLQTGKRSPSSPIPMSPDEVRLYTNSVESFGSIYASQNASLNDLSADNGKHRRRESASTTGTGRHRHRSRSAQPGKGKKQSSTAKDTSPDPDVDAADRGRSKSRKDGSDTRSPSSPLPMVPADSDTGAESNPDGAFRFVSQNRSRLQRSTSRRPERGTSSRRDASPDRRTGRQRSPSRRREYEGQHTSMDSRSKRRDHSEDSRAKSSHDAIAELDAMAQSLRGGAVSNPRLGSRSKELAQAELEARRLSLARRPSAPTIPVPPTNNAHSKSNSESVVAPPPLFRNQTDSGLRPLLLSSAKYDSSPSKGRPGTPKAMESETAQYEYTNHVDPLPNDIYQLPARTYSANAVREEGSGWGSTEVPQNMPRHPAFDHRVGTSRGTSRTRTSSPNGHRGKSVERRRVVPGGLPEDQPIVFGSGSDAEEPIYRTVDGPTFIPELQHLAIPPPPPPPPPPPAPPKDLRIQTDLVAATNTSLPRSAYPMSAVDMSSASSDKQQRRASSGKPDGPFMGKIRGMIRSTSKPRDNSARSPNMDDSILSPYETKMPQSLAAFGDR